MAVILSLPKYAPDATSQEVVTGYELQSCAPTVGLPLFSGSWTDVTGSPFASPNNIVDVNGTSVTQYRARPVRQVTVNSQTYTLDTPWSAPFTVGDPVNPGAQLYDAWFTRWLLPALRFTYLNDKGVAQSNGTVLAENTGAGNGLWVPDGKQTRFSLQYVVNDDPVKVLNSGFRMIRKDSTGALVSCLPDIDYTVELKNGVVEFAKAPASTDYIRFDFMAADFVNEDLLEGLASAINALSQFGVNGYQTHRENNLVFLQTPLNSDLVELVCKLAIYLMRQGQTESALRMTMSWRDGGIQEDFNSNRALEFLVGDLQLTESSLQRAANAYIRSHTVPITRGDFDLQWDITQMTPFNVNIFAPYSGLELGRSLFYSWWL